MYLLAVAVKKCVEQAFSKKKNNIIIKKKYYYMKLKK